MVEGVSGAASYGVANVRSELAANNIRQSNEQDRQTAEELRETSQTREEERRESRKIPGLGNAVDITA
ncbi:hypothetical protein [Roseibium litorale]|uniref:Uncharacterized protein n=1 Tax=Roseibium litorale TaxID=2803841 RepID=A0ABR9CLE9_9HYPH|nr:hypothetical protein [Roseibium litorale]MBD8891679.1 hypothetical protein [Roseibium litorale]